jgi:uncharacterized SAM-binding protein YcdF (DUF218 family)
MRARIGVTTIAVYLGAALLVALIFGFVLFATTAGRKPPDRIADADGIVVLTGAEHRIAEGMRLLTLGRAKRLLISGVNPKTTRDEIRRRNGGGERLFDCCVDIGYVAQDTVGNADEAMEWARAHGYRSLIVVTSSYHMPRSLAEIARVLPEAELIASPVVPRNLAEQPWWLSASTMRILFSEYCKYLPAAAKLVAARLVRTLDGGTLAAHSDSDGTLQQTP